MAERFPSLAALIAFEAVARQGSFKRAADELALTESAVSHRVRQIERFYDVRMLVRGPQGAALTANGEALLDSVRYVVQALRTTGLRLRGTRRRPLKVSLAPAIASMWLVPRIAEFQRAMPDTELEIDSTSHLADLRLGEADVAVRSGPGGWPGVDAVRLSEERLVPLCTPRYARSLDLREAGDLQRARLLRNDKLGWKSWFDAAGLRWDEPRPGPTYREVRTLLDAAASDQGVALCFSSLAGLARRTHGLESATDVTAPSPFSYYAVVLPEARERPEVATFVDWVEASFRVLSTGGGEDRRH